MMSYSTIQELAREAAERAQEEGTRPLSAKDTLKALEGQSQDRIPFLGDYVPEGLVLDPNVEPYFVDATGRGDEDEPALTRAAFTKIVKRWVQSGEPVFFGVIEAGAFQVVVGLYRPAWGDFTKTGKLTNHELRQVRGS